MLFTPPTEKERMIDALERADLLAIRRVLRALSREADALLAVLALDQTIVEFAGDDSVMPKKFPRLERSVPCFDGCLGVDGEEHDVGFVKVRTLRGMPSYGVFVVEPRPMVTGKLFELLEGAMERLEEIVVT